MARKPTNDGFGESAKLNNATYNDYYTRLKNLALSIFKWNHLPNDIPEDFVEKTLYNFGKAIFINDDMLGYMILRVSPYGDLNVYGKPIKYTATGSGNSYNKVFGINDCVLIENNRLQISTHLPIELFSLRLYEVERTLDVNIKSQKTPVLVACDEKVRLTLRNLYMQYDGNQPFIFGDKNLVNHVSGIDGSFKVLNTESPYVADKLMIYKHEIWNDALTFLGINNANTDKKERLIVDEVTSNDEQINMCAQTMLLCRQEACNKINKMFNLTLSVEMRKFDNIGQFKEFESEAIEGEDNINE